MQKKRLLILLIFIFLCACTFIDKNERSNEQRNEDDVILLKQFDEIVKKAEEYVMDSNGREVKSVFQHRTDRKWKIEFNDGLILFYDEKTGVIEQLN